MVLSNEPNKNGWHFFRIFPLSEPTVQHRQIIVKTSSVANARCIAERLYAEPFDITTETDVLYHDFDATTEYVYVYNPQGHQMPADWKLGVGANKGLYAVCSRSYKLATLSRVLSS